jgi:hypothetical protein
MATLGVSIKSDFDQASKDLEQFQAQSESTTRSIKKFQDSFKGEQVDKFLDKQKLSSTALKSTRGELVANKSEFRALQREIERLIKKGIDPQDESVKKLTTQYNKLEKELQENEKAQISSAEASKAATNIYDGVAKALLAVGAAAVAGATALVKNSLATAEAGDEYAKASRRIGISAEALQELTFAADRQGVSGEELSKGLEKLNKNVGDLRGGYGALNVALKGSNPELLANLKNAKNNQEAWELSVDALNKTSNELDRAALAQALFGRSGLKLLTVTEAGVDGIKDLREEARKYGIITNEQAVAAEALVDAQTNLTAAFKGVSNEAGAKLFPALTNIINKFTQVITKTDVLDTVLKEITNVFDIIAEDVLTINNLEKGVSALSIVFKILFTVIDAIRLNLAVTFNFFKATFIPLINGVKGVIAAFDILKKKGLKGAGAAFKELGKAGLDSILDIKDGFVSVAKDVKDTAMRNVELWSDSNKAIVENEKQTAEERKTILEEGAVLNSEMSQKLFNEQIVKLNEIKEAENLNYQERKAALQGFLNNRQLLHKLDADTRIKLEEEVIKRQKKLRDDFINTTLGTTKTFVDSFANLGNNIIGILENVGKESRASAIASKVISIAEATVNTALAVTKALASLPFPANIAAGATTGLAGAAQIAKIATTPIPSAQTGTSPEGITVNTGRGRTGQDNVGVSVADGETVNVTPRGEEAERTQEFNFKINEEVIFSVMQRGIDGGNVNITTDNIQGFSLA